MRATLRQLRVFEAVARLKSVSCGAEEVCLSQSAASMSLKDLEQALEVNLFHRNGKRIELNENGRRIFPLAQSILNLVQDLENNASSSQNFGPLRIRACSTAGNYMLAPVVAKLLESFPKAQIDLQLQPSVEVINSVERLACEIGFIESPCNRRSMQIQPLIKDRLVVVAHPDHPFSDGRKIRKAQLADATWCLLLANTYTRNMFTLAMKAYPLKIAMECDSVTAIKRAVMANAGLGCISEHAAADEVQKGNLVILEIEDMELVRHISLVVPTGVYRNELCRHFLEICRTHMLAPDIDWEIDHISMTKVAARRDAA